MAPQIADKASRSLRNREAEVIKEWLKAVIDDLELPSLQTFPTQALTTAFPQIISRLADNMVNPLGDAFVGAEFAKAVAQLAEVREEDTSIIKVVEDYALLHRLLIDALAKDLRGSDQEVVRVLQRLDDGFRQILTSGLEFYTDRRSEKLQRLAHTDPLTGLFNMRHFRRRLHEYLEMYNRYRIPFSIMMVDIDKMKQLNDTKGHQMGDRALKHLAQVMTSQKRETDIAFRYGGDEFFLLMPGISTDDGEALAKRIIFEVNKIHEDTQGREMTNVSIGLVSCPENGTDVGLLRSRADKALYLAKQMGGGIVACYRETEEETR